MPNLNNSRAGWIVALVAIAFSALGGMITLSAKAGALESRVGALEQRGAAIDAKLDAISAQLNRIAGKLDDKEK